MAACINAMVWENKEQNIIEGITTSNRYVNRYSSQKYIETWEADNQKQWQCQ